MKKSLFVLAAGLMATTSAVAMDVSNPFYVPMKGDFLSETGVQYLNGNHGQEESLLGTETLSYGITRNFSVNATIGDVLSFDGWDEKKGKRLSGHNKYDNPMWGVGLKYNMVDCCRTDWKVQLGANYEQGRRDHQEKIFSGYVKAGYQVKNFLPYAQVEIDKPVGRYEEGPTWKGRIALDTVFSKKVNLDTGVSYMWRYAKNEVRETTLANKHASEWSLDAGLNYVFSDCMSVGLTARYVLDAKPNNYDTYAVGTNFKVAF